MKILIISSSQRENSQSIAVAKYLQTNILNKMTDIDSSLLDLSLYPFLLDHYGIGREQAQLLAKEKDDVLRQLYRCTSIGLGVS